MARANTGAPIIDAMTLTGISTPATNTLLRRSDAVSRAEPKMMDVGRTKTSSLD